MCVIVALPTELLEDFEDDMLGVTGMDTPGIWLPFRVVWEAMLRCIYAALSTMQVLWTMLR